MGKMKVVFFFNIIFVSIALCCAQISFTECEYKDELFTGVTISTSDNSVEVKMFNSNGQEVEFMNPNDIGLPYTIQIKNISKNIQNYKLYWCPDTAISNNGSDLIEFTFNFDKVKSNPYDLFDSFFYKSYKVVALETYQLKPGMTDEISFVCSDAYLLDPINSNVIIDNTAEGLEMGNGKVGFYFYVDVTSQSSTTPISL